MKKISAFLFFFSTLFSSEPIVEERHHIFILGLLSYLHNQKAIEPKPGHDIAALIAWDVENIHQTPKFVIDRNRNLEKQGNIFHAEIMAIERAAREKGELAGQPYSARLTNATLYSSLEPCPFCTAGITVAHIPKVVYFMEDHNLRDGETFDALFPFPVEFLGKKVPLLQSSTHPFAEKVNEELRNRSEDVDFSRYFKERFVPEIIGLGHQLFCSYEVIYEENKELYKEVAKAVIN